MSKVTRITVTPAATQKETARRVLDALRAAPHRPYIEKDGHLWNDGVTRTDEHHDVHIVLGENATGVTFSRLFDDEITGWATECTNQEKGWYRKCGDGVVLRTTRDGEFTGPDTDVLGLVTLCVRRAAANDRLVAAR